MTHLLSFLLGMAAGLGLRKRCPHCDQGECDPSVRLVRTGPRAPGTRRRQ